MKFVKAKKGLGQHFLNDISIAKEISQSIDTDIYTKKTICLEIGPGMGVLTQFLITNKNIDFHAIEIDEESTSYLIKKYPEIEANLIYDDFLKFRLSENFNENLIVIGNFPYNISSQILFKLLENKQIVSQIVCMLQKEVAERITSPPGKKKYGILSVFLQAYYKTEYLFTVVETAFTPPPRVKSAVIRLVRNDTKKLDCDESMFYRVIKTTFNQRRKTIRNSLKPIINDKRFNDEILSKRPEQLSVKEFVYLTNIVSEFKGL